MHRGISAVESEEELERKIYIEKVIVACSKIFTCARQLGFPTLPEEAPSSDTLLESSESIQTEQISDALEKEKESEKKGAEMTKGLAVLSKTGRDLHSLLIETNIVEGKLVCGACGHEYAVKEGIANFLLPSHLV